MLSMMQIAGFIFTLVIVLAVSIYSGKQVKDAKDFDSAGKSSGTLLVMGAILGTLVGGSSTVGTAQLAFSFGFSGWWFTLGAGIACLLLALVFNKPLRASSGATLVGIISDEYGETIGVVASVLSSIGTFINILSQIIAATTVVQIIIPTVSVNLALLISAALMIAYVVFGGVKGAGMVGVVKLVLLIAAVLISVIIVISRCNGIAMLWNNLDHDKYFNLFARGIGKDCGAGLSLILGVLSTQSYAQALLAGKSDKVSRNAALLDAAIIPLIGIGGILVGEYMQLTNPDMPAKMAFTQFVIDNIPPFAAGIILAALLLAVVGTGAGLSLGISTVLSNNIIKKRTRKFDDPKKNLFLSRMIIIVCLMAACIMCACPIGDTILNFAFMSMGLRGAVLFVPLCAAIWVKSGIDSKYILYSVTVSPLVVLIFGVWDFLPFNSLFLGLMVSVIIISTGIIVHKRDNRNNLKQL